MKNLEIPSFLDRRNKKIKTVSAVQTKLRPLTIKDKVDLKTFSQKKKSLTIRYKEKIAHSVIFYVAKGSDTFGKLRKSLNIEDRELRSGIRYAMTNKVPFPSIKGKGKTRHLAILYKTLCIKGKRYQVIDL